MFLSVARREALGAELPSSSHSVQDVSFQIEKLHILDAIVVLPRSIVLYNLPECQKNL